MYHIFPFIFWDIQPRNGYETCSWGYSILPTSEKHDLPWRREMPCFLIGKGLWVTDLSVESSFGRVGGWEGGGLALFMKILP